MRLRPKIQALLRRALTGDLQRQDGGIRPVRRRERGQFVLVDCMKRLAGYQGIAGSAPRAGERKA